MSYTSPSHEVGEDFAIALEALNLNNRYEISNLTVIAKENTEHAFAISEALKNHIKQVGYVISFKAFDCLY
jgi:pre-mRNA cleavage complex 2 protein Pcf11